MLSLDLFPEDEWQDASVFEIGDFNIGLEVALHLERFTRRQLNRHLLVGNHVLQIEQNVYFLRSFDAQ